VASHGQVLVLDWDNKAPERPAEEVKPARTRKSRRGG
jgi:hypothetical protein